MKRRSVGQISGAANPVTSQASFLCSDGLRAVRFRALRETITDPRFYERFFALIDRYRVFSERADSREMLEWLRGRRG